MMSPRLLLLPRQVATRLQQQVLSCARPQSTSSETSSSSSSSEEQQELRVPPSQMPNMMDIGSRRIFNEEHDIFRESVRKFAREVLKPQQPAFEAAGMPTRQVWEEMGAQGLLGVGLPEEEGGSGGTFKHEAICIEEACYAQVRDSEKLFSLETHHYSLATYRLPPQTWPCTPRSAYPTSTSTALRS